MFYFIFSNNTDNAGANAGSAADGNGAGADGKANKTGSGRLSSSSSSDSSASGSSSSSSAVRENPSRESSPLHLSLKLFNQWLPLKYEDCGGGAKPDPNADPAGLLATPFLAPRGLSDEVFRPYSRTAVEAAPHASRGPSPCTFTSRGLSDDSDDENDEESNLVDDKADTEEGLEVVSSQDPQEVARFNNYMDAIYRFAQPASF